jgi:hypothetical protein
MVGIGLLPEGLIKLVEKGILPEPTLVETEPPALSAGRLHLSRIETQHSLDRVLLALPRREQLEAFNLLEEGGGDDGLYRRPDPLVQGPVTGRSWRGIVGMQLAGRNDIAGQHPCIVPGRRGGLGAKVTGWKNEEEERSEEHRG